MTLPASWWQDWHAGEAFELHLEGLIELSLTLSPPGDYEGSNKWQNNDAYLDFGRVRALSYLDACSAFHATDQ